MRRPIAADSRARAAGERRVGVIRGAADARLGARIDQAKQRGIVLPSALMVASMMLATSAAWLEISMAHARHGSNVHDYVRAAQAADGALALCVQALRVGVAPVLPARGGERAHWKEAATFEGAGAYEPVPSWAGSAKAPQCAIEVVALEGRPDASAYWITARGFGMSASTEAWLQLMLAIEEGRERQAWRRIVAAPSLR